MTRGRLSGRMRPWYPWLAVGVALILVALVAGRPRTDGPPLDPTSTGRLGTKAVVDVLSDLGVDVSVASTAPGPADTAALLLVDDFDEPGRQEVARWVEAGGTLVLTDVFSELNPARPDLGDRADILLREEDQLEGGCRRDLTRADRIIAPGAVYQEPPSGATTCFSRGADAWMVVVKAGAGRIVSLGGASPLVNANLDEGDNGLLIVDLLAPGALGGATGGDRVVILRPVPAGGGDAGLWSLIGRRVKLALLQLAVAFVVVALWRSRRLGRPVLEPQPVQIEASELVVAVGELMQRARARPQAAAALRSDLARTLTSQLGLAPTTPPDVVAEAIAARRPSIGADEVMAALAGPPPSGEDALVALSQQIESIRARMTASGPVEQPEVSDAHT